MHRPELCGPRAPTLAALLVALLWAGPAETQAGSAPAARAPSAALPAMRITPPRELHVGEHARLELEVSLPAQAAGPLLITPFCEGQALEVVKGRLLRSDARDPNERPLRFELPVLARAAGVARVGVQLLAYVCEHQERCRAVEAEARADVVVLP
jgi:hypothetical protein